MKPEWKEGSIFSEIWMKSIPACTKAWKLEKKGVHIAGAEWAEQGGKWVYFMSRKELELDQMWGKQSIKIKIKKNVSIVNPNILPQQVGE